VTQADWNCYKGATTKMLEFKDALNRVLERVSRLDNETVGLADLNCRVLAESLYSNLDLPVSDNSSMDGYALRAKDIQKASQNSPVTLSVEGTVPAGNVSDVEVERGTCVRLFTGSFLPKGADAVIMQEDTETVAESTSIRCLDSVKPWENIRFQGEDVKKGALLLEVGARVRARHLGVMAAIGKSEMKVSRRPKVGILSTGHELQEAGTQLAPGAIYESNRLILSEMVRQIGGVPQVYPLVDDTMEATKAALEQAASENDALITSGGVSVGDFDLIRPAIEALGGTIDFWKVRLRPGKPFVFAKLNGKPVFGLPGNPVSAVTTYMALARPALLQMQGATDVQANTRPCRLNESIANRSDRPHFFRVQLDESDGVSSAGLQGSHALQSLSKADGWLCVDPGQSLAEGDAVLVMIWDD
jgi:molybdopterin molybdotransferase